MTGDGDGRLCLLFFDANHRCFGSRLFSFPIHLPATVEELFPSPPRQLERRLQRAPDHDWLRSLVPARRPHHHTAQRIAVRGEVKGRHHDVFLAPRVEGS